jgi:hypothetical protein
VVTRRAFGFGLLGSIGLLLVGVPLWAVDEDAFLLAAIEACFPATGDLPSPGDCGAVAAVRAYVAEMPSTLQWQVRGLFRVIESHTLATRGSRFSKLDLATRTAALAALATSAVYPERLLANGIKQLCAMGYWSRPQTWAHLGYDGPLVNR